MKDLFYIAPFSPDAINNSHESEPLLHAVYLFTDGNGSIEIDRVAIAIEKNELLVISKGQILQFKENNCSGYCLKFSDSFWRHTPISANNCKAVLFDTGIVKHKMKIFPTDTENLAGLFNAALCDYNSRDYSNKPDVLAAYLKIIVIKIANLHALLKEDIGDDSNRLYQDFTALVNSNATTIHDVVSYAEKLGVSVRKLAAACNASGKGTKEIINERLVAEAKRALQFTGKPVKMIASELHFATPYQFSSFFKKHAGIAPENYRKQFVKIGI